jgi:UDP-glucose 4-epimerase
VTRRALVTGGAGFIGSHVAEAFLADGWDVAVVDNLSTGSRANLPAAARFFEADITDAGALDAVFAAARPDVVAHLAAQTSVRVSTQDPARDLRVNVLGTLLLAERAARSGARQFIFSSSGGALYGDGVPVPTAETQPAAPASPYGVSKLAAEAYLGWAQRALGLGCCSLRYANVYGPRQDPHGEAGVVAIFIGRMLDGEHPVINGDGLQTRDYVFVQDVVAANLAAAAHGLTGAFNVGCGVETDVTELFDRIAGLTGFAGERRHGPGLPGEQRRSCLDASRLRGATGWAPGHDLASGLAHTVAWFAERRVAR